jgi:proline iminopeptidase
MNQEGFLALSAAFDEGHFATGDGHMIWYGQYGKPDGAPLFWLHGGPGSGASMRQLQLIDLSRYRVVLSDQRGCGRSLPLGAIAANETCLLVSDIERLRTHLRLGHMVLGGGSWGAALALAYAAKHAASISALVLRAPFLATQKEIDAFFQPAPESADTCWEEFAALAPPSQRSRLLPWLADRLEAADAGECARLARGWRRYEQRRENGSLADAPVDDALVARYRVQAHYLRHGCFLNQGDLLEAARGLAGMPVALLHGDADLLCPPDNARMLQRSLAGSRLRMVAGAGHDPFHPGMAQALVSALDCHARHGNFTAWEAHA